MFEFHIYIYSICLLIAVLLVGLYLFKANNGFAKNLILPSLVMLMSGITIVMLFRLDTIVHGDLYTFGLTFDIAWANEYWLLQRSVMGFNTISIAIALGMVVKERLGKRFSPDSDSHETTSKETQEQPHPQKKKTPTEKKKTRKEHETAPQKTMEELERETI